MTSALPPPRQFLYTLAPMALLRSAATVGGYTMVSRLLGFVREMLVAAFLGASPISGAFNAAFVPLFAGKLAREGRPVARRFAEDALAVLLAALLTFLVAGELLA